MNSPIASSNTIDSFIHKLQNSVLSPEIKKEVTLRCRQASNQDQSLSHLQQLVGQSINKLPQKQSKQLQKWWTLVKQSEGKEEKTEVKQQEEIKQDSFKFDSDSYSYESSFDDVDDDFRKEQMDIENNN